eukprot:CAMPEP_0114995818 /NCGR_PEP_ID=MMETSP0216-20121206/13952_1 /TAXON_ID=223996 /ORGANISM="Protocruzia adherens, Strain Boccale" /LENGTH=266 /DNA_ID=CAMNT_0002359925 /DNA_START=742 /DNA_END=1539 /DNA_ORIENTATION=-
MSSGGLVTAMKSLADIEMLWIGWCGTEIPECDREYVNERLRNEFNCTAVFLSCELIEDYYNGFANNILWPLFHYMLTPLADYDVNTMDKQWDAYKVANKLFAETVVSVYQEHDLIWVHDYHLMLVPKYIRKRLKGKNDPQIGWFLHTPFPSSEIYRLLPFREVILKGLLSSNLVGFHIVDYKRHFLNACSRILGLNCTPEGVDNTGKLGFFCTVEVFPIGIEPKEFYEQMVVPEVESHLDELERAFEGQMVILGIDRLDYIKGIPN